MTPLCPAVAGKPELTAMLRQSPQDFLVYEQLGFEPSGEGEHAFLHLEKRELNSMELLERIARLSGIPGRDIGMSGLKDRRAVTRQWFSVRMAGKPEPDWRQLELADDVRVLQVSRHSRKLKRGVHRANRFVLRLHQLDGDRADLLQRLQRVKVQGVPNYFGEQRFGRDGSTLAQARAWMASGGRKISRTKRSLFLSALRAFIFNTLLADRVIKANWNEVLSGDVCMLQGTRSLFTCETADEDIRQRAGRGDIHPGLPLWGRGMQRTSEERVAQQMAVLADRASVPDGTDICLFLERMGLELSYRAARVLPDDFSWQFCDDDALQLEFALASGSYATAVLAELVQYTVNKRMTSNNKGKQDSSE
jgi:tRNA pseudouridine13 synthase